MQNPAELDGFEFIEFTSNDRALLEGVLERACFTKIARHRSKDVDLWRQGEINIIANYDEKLAARHFRREHGPSTCGIGFRVKDVRKAIDHIARAGGELVESAAGPMEIVLPAIRGIGGSLIYLVDTYGEDSPSIYDIDFEYISGIDRHPTGAGLLGIDHLTNNVYRGRMDYWAAFYERLFGFQEYRYYDIKGEYTGLVSRALQAPDGKIRIPINEEAGSGKGQVEEFLREFNGEGIQHIAFYCDDLPACYDRLKAAGMKFMTPPPDTYYDLVGKRLPGHDEDLSEIQSRGILIDGADEGGGMRILLQIFSENLLGPAFFEFIERKGNEGFGEGNFTALFESIERDQIERGVLAAGA